MEHIWVTQRGESINVRDMDEIHIKRTIKCLKGEDKSIIPEGYLGRKKKKWLQIFHDELINRNWWIL